MRGRKPKPAALQLLHGDPNSRSRAKLAARVAAEPAIHEPQGMEPFDDFSQSQLSIWDDAVRNAPRGVLAQIDRWSLRTWVVACDLHWQACKLQAKTTLLVKVTKADAPQAQLQVSPLIPLINRQAVIMLKAASELGFTPTARPRLYTAGEPNTMLPSVGGTRLHPKHSTSLEGYLANPPSRPTIN